MSESETRVRSLLARMTLEEKVGQLSLRQSDEGTVSDDLRAALREGRLGGVLNEVDAEVAREIQRTAREESRLGIPLLLGRDVIHGFATVFPIPIGQAAAWDPALVEACARASAEEAAAAGVNWAFAPMLDVGRDPRWGRVAETFGEDPHLVGALGAATVRGLQDAAPGPDPGTALRAPTAIAACAKHFAGYGASEGGRDYAATFVPEPELRDVHLAPFRAALDAGAASVMPSFSDLNGVPATGNAWLLTSVLRDEWGFDGLVVSDWNAVRELSTHGLTDGDRDAARTAALAGVDLEMASPTYADHLADLVRDGTVPVARLDAMVANVLRVKARLGLLDGPRETPAPPAPDAFLGLARRAATRSAVLLKNDRATLPLDAGALRSVAVLGPLADDPYEPLGTWAFDGDVSRSQTLLGALRHALGDGVAVEHARVLATTRDASDAGFPAAVALARRSDLAVLVLGEEAILSGEAHCRADLRLPGAQEALVAAVAATGTPVVLVVMAGRPLALADVLPHADALLFAFHPGTMGGPALADLLLGAAVPSGKLPATVPRVTGQVPLYYAHRPTGRPPTPETVVTLDQIAPRAPQTSVGNTSFYLDAGAAPLFPFGFGLSYTTFAYAGVRASTQAVRLGDALTLTADVTNTGAVEAEEVVQLYVRDLVGSRTRPVRELKGFRRVRLAPGETRPVAFALPTDALAFHGHDGRARTEPGAFHAWIGGSSEATEGVAFEVVATPSA